MASTWRRGSRLEEMPKAHNLSCGERYRRGFRDRITIEMWSTVAEASRHRFSDAEISTATASAVGHPESTGAQHNSPPTVPPFTGGVATSRDILGTMKLAATLTSSPRSSEVDTPEGSCTPTAVQVTASSSSHMGPVTDGRHKPSAVVCGRGWSVWRQRSRGCSTPFMVKGIVPGHQRHPPTASTGVRG
ncbi:hypothetical protein HPB51_003083 [Rhipicephalus microplus]|uniref:Uncharacterized protein n=1 Tax=Rhipicephalus microplus TaxID=6941 RepID=A0A9J6EEN2_RHIMP|nr:hypothetical protein HPB51_003083 [Rhipicephalus microplus]